MITSENIRKALRTMPGKMIVGCVIGLTYTGILASPSTGSRTSGKTKCRKRLASFGCLMAYASFLHWLHWIQMIVYEHRKGSSVY